MESGKPFTRQLIAPCGMNCGICIAFLRDKKPCLGCRVNCETKPKHCVSCVIANCEHMPVAGFCYDCYKYPCARIKNLDKRYRTKYHTSFFDNLNRIKDNGIELFLESENLKHTCPKCGQHLSVHRDFCISCKEVYR